MERERGGRDRTPRWRLSLVPFPYCFDAISSHFPLSFQLIFFLCSLFSSLRFSSLIFHTASLFVLPVKFAAACAKCVNDMFELTALLFGWGAVAAKGKRSCSLLMKMRTFFFLPKTKKDLPKRENKEKKDFLSCGGLGFFSDWDNQNNNS